MASMAPITMFMKGRGPMPGKKVPVKGLKRGMPVMDNEAAETQPDNERAEGEKPAKKRRRVASPLAGYRRP